MDYEKLSLSYDLDELRIDIGCLFAFSSSFGSVDLMKYVMQLKEDFENLSQNIEKLGLKDKKIENTKEKVCSNNVIRFHK